VSTRAVSNGTTVIIDFAGFSSGGMRLQDVLSTNPDGTTNNCSSRPHGPRCCDGMPPFEVGVGGVWTRVARRGKAR